MNRETLCSKALRLRLLLCLCLTGLSLGTVFWSWQTMETARLEQERLQDEVTHLYQQQAHPSLGFPDVRRAISRLQEHGFFQPEKRLAWIDALEIARQQQAIPALHYEFHPQQPLNNSSGYFHVSTMNLELSLNHELELEPFLKTLMSQESALVKVRACHLKPQPNRPSPVTPGPNIQAHCQLDWITGQLSGSATP